jgi:hypothetical protein
MNCDEKMNHEVIPNLSLAETLSDVNAFEISKKRQ